MFLIFHCYYSNEQVNHTSKMGMVYAHFVQGLKAKMLLTATLVHVSLFIVLSTL